MNRCMRQTGLLLCCMLGLATAAQAREKTTSGQRVYGWIEKGVVMPAQAVVKMKLDTGALTSSMHARDIELYTIHGDDDGVRFTLELEDERSGKLVKKRMDLEVERYLKVRGAGGQDRRPVVNLDICIGDHVFQEQFSLRDRSNMIYPVLLGRRVLQKIGLVDSGATFLTEPECGVRRSWWKKKTAGGDGR